nr:MAG TPA: hypothetical protein [Bacteriophage sp.]
MTLVIYFNPILTQFIKRAKWYNLIYSSVL